MRKKKDIKAYLKSCGENVKIYPLSRIINPQVIKIGDHSQIDDFTFINGGKGLTIGKYVHITYFSSITGNGTAEIGDYVGIASGSRIFTSTNIHQEAWSMSAAAPRWMQRFKTGQVQIEKFSFIGSNSIILPGVLIGEGAVVGALSLVNKNIEPWSINAGIPCRKIAKRLKPSQALTDM